jgi:hypothetical protein
MDQSAPSTCVDMAARDRHLRLSMNAATPAERLAAMRVLIERSWDMLRRNPEGLAHFRRRNYKARSISQIAGRMPHGA